MAVTAWPRRTSSERMHALFLAGAQRYNSLLKTVPNISPKELTRNLGELVGRLLARRHAGCDFGRTQLPQRA
jgi:DNA-binding HxlR family transcriptional regulator